MSLGLSNSDVSYLQRHTSEMNLHEVSPGDDQLIQPSLDSGTLQQLPPSFLSQQIVDKNAPETNHFVQVSGEASTLGFVTLKTGSEKSSEMAPKMEMVSTSVSSDTITNLVTMTSECLV